MKNDMDFKMQRAQTDADLSRISMPVNTHPLLDHIGSEFGMMRDMIRQFKVTPEEVMPDGTLLIDAINKKNMELHLIPQLRSDEWAGLTVWHRNMAKTIINEADNAVGQACNQTNYASGKYDMSHLKVSEVEEPVSKPMGTSVFEEVPKNGSSNSQDTLSGLKRPLHRTRSNRLIHNLAKSLVTELKREGTPRSIGTKAGAAAASLILLYDAARMLLSNGIRGLTPDVVIYGLERAVVDGLIIGVQVAVVVGLSGLVCRLGSKISAAKKPQESAGMPY